jgi:hypothetical protein
MAISNEMLTEKVQDIVLEKVCSVSADEDAKRAGISKQVTVRVNFDGVDLSDVFHAAMRPTIIKWQGSARSKYESLPKTVEIAFYEAGRRDPMQASAEKFAKMSPEQQAEYLKKLQEIASSK